jgi:hypothetical protein
MSLKKTGRNRSSGNINRFLDATAATTEDLGERK